MERNKIQEFKNYSLKLKYANRIWEEYNNDISSINHYTKPSRIGKGHDIVRPILWDYIIQMAVNNSKSNNIIQFSRGRDELYESYFTENAYFRSIQGFIDGLKNKENCIIINLVSDLEVRKNRNKVRFEKGGHYVSDQTMDKVYSHDIFNYIKKGENFGFIGIQNYSIPVYTIINNKFLSEIELFQFLEYNVNEVIRYYNEFKENKKWN